MLFRLISSVFSTRVDDVGLSIYYCLRLFKFKQGEVLWGRHTFVSLFPLVDLAVPSLGGDVG